MQKWCAVGKHDRAFAQHFRSMCWQEALRALHKQLAQAKRTLSPGMRRMHTLKARLADLRAELLADICSLPEMLDDGFYTLREEGTDGPLAPQCNACSSRWRGVNLGGWLLWEPGPANMSPLVKSLDSTAIPKDEWTLCEDLIAKYGRTQAEAIVHQHRATHVTREDFVDMKRLGVNSVRVPFPYWAIIGPREGDPFIGPCTEFLDAALDWGNEVGLSVVLCLHAAIGFQSSDPPCGRGNEHWDPSDFDVEATIEVLRQVAKRYGHHSALAAICILNEPGGDLPAKTLNRYFTEAYTALRDGQGLPESVQIMLPVFHHDFSDFAGRYTAHKGYSNVVFDIHCYQVFGDPYAGWCKMSLAEHLRYASASSRLHQAKVIANHGERAVVSEFSLGLPMWDKKYLIRQEIAALTEAEQDLLHRSFAVRQLRVFAKYTEGWFFWSWKDDSGAAWAFSESVSRRWMPAICEQPLQAVDSVSSGSTRESRCKLKPEQVAEEGFPMKRQRPSDGLELPNLCIA